jgi:hypothetical protein
VGLAFLKECLEYLKTVEGVTFVFHGVNITGLGTIVNKSDEIFIALP